MTASGPFAMGPSGAGQTGWSSRRTAPTTAPIVPLGPGGSSALGMNLTKSAAPALKKERPKSQDVKKEKEEEEDIEVYSDPDEGVEIIDMQDVRTMDWMAPDTLRKERISKKKKRIKREDDSNHRPEGNDAHCMDIFQQMLMGV